MTYKDFIRKSVNVRKKREIILLSELLDLYDEYYKSKRKELIEHSTGTNFKKQAKSIAYFAFFT